MKSIVSFCLFACLFFTAGEASAALEQASLPPPQEEERLAPANLELTFTGPVDLARSTAVLLDAEGTVLPTGKPFLSGPEESIFKIPLDPAMRPASIRSTGACSRWTAAAPKANTSSGSILSSLAEKHL